MSITMIGLDTAKSAFQVHAIDETGTAVIRCKLRRNELIPFFEKRDACTIVLEVCGGRPPLGPHADRSGARCEIDRARSGQAVLPAARRPR
jgi:hypothetical protein